MTIYQRALVNGKTIFYREAGAKDAPTILLLHGFPTSSHMFRNLIPVLAQRYHVIAPDFPGFGFSDAPDRKTFRYTFENLANVIDNFTLAIGLDRYAIYVFDYGAPVGLRLALAHPERITAIISQNGNAYEEGLSQGWNPIQKYWKEPTPANRAALRDFLTPEATKSQYLHGAPDETLVAPEAYELDSALLARAAMMRFSSTCFSTMQVRSPCSRSSRSISARTVLRCSRSGARTIRSSFQRAPRRTGVTSRTPKCASSTLAISPLKRTVPRLERRYSPSLDNGWG